MSRYMNSKEDGMIARRYVLALCCVMTTLIACGEDSDVQYQQIENSGPMELEDFVDEENLEPSSNADHIPSEQRKIIRSGSIRLEVNSVDSAERSLLLFVKAQAGYISNASRKKLEGETMMGEVEIRVPFNNFDLVVNHVRSLGNVESEQITSNDVTEEYIDLEARISTQQQLEVRLLDLLAKRSGKLADIVEIEEKLASVRSGIERAQGKLRHIQSRVSMSTLSVTMFEPGGVGTSDTETFGGEIQQAIDESVDGLVTIAAMALRLIIVLVPLCLIGWILYRILKPVIKRAEQKKELKEIPTQEEQKESLQ